MHEELKSIMGIEIANCSTCESLGSEGDGPEYNGSWSVCNSHDQYGHLKSFPFKKEMKCWIPNFWFTKFADMVTGIEEKDDLAADAYHAAYNEFVKKQLEIKNQQKRILALEGSLSAIHILMIQIGGPLNDNFLKYSKEQSKIFYQIQEIIEELNIK